VKIYFPVTEDEVRRICLSWPEDELSQAEDRRAVRDHAVSTVKGESS
jgi:hypothetical protein